MELIKVIVVFVAILVLLNLKLPLFSGMLGGTVLLLIFFGIGIPEFGDIAFRSVTSWGTLEVVIALYVITLLQRMLEKRKFLTLAQESLNGLMKDRRLNAAFASIFIGMMPSAAAAVSYTHLSAGHDDDDDSQSGQRTLRHPSGDFGSDPGDAQS